MSTAKYPLWRYIYVYYCDSTDEAIVEFLRFALSYEGQSVMAKHFASPLSAQHAEKQRVKLGK